jgi:hypothetical protein
MVRYRLWRPSNQSRCQERCKRCYQMGAKGQEESYCSEVRWKLMLSGWYANKSWREAFLCIHLIRTFRSNKSKAKSLELEFSFAMVNNMSGYFDAIRCRAKVAKYTMHDLWRSAITNWTQRLPIQVVQVFAWHSSITTTRKYYLAIGAEDLALASEWLNKFWQGLVSDWH